LRVWDASRKTFRGGRGGRNVELAAAPLLAGGGFSEFSSGLRDAWRRVSDGRLRLRPVPAFQAEDAIPDHEHRVGPDLPCVCAAPFLLLDYFRAGRGGALVGSWFLAGTVPGPGSIREGEGG